VWPSGPGAGGGCMSLTDDEKQYLAEHTLAVLGTGKRDGSPQLSTIYYDWDGERVFISVTSDRAKWKNALRQPNVALLVPDGRKQLIVYGTAEGITDPDERDERMVSLRARMGRPVEDRAAMRAELDAANRVMLAITPERAFRND